MDQIWYPTHSSSCHSMSSLPVYALLSLELQPAIVSCCWSTTCPSVAHSKSIPFLEKLEGSILYLTLISAATAHDIYHIRPVSMSATLNLVPTPWKQTSSHSIAPKLSLLLWQCLFQDNCCVVETKSTQIVCIGNGTNTFRSSTLLWGDSGA